MTGPGGRFEEAGRKRLDKAADLERRNAELTGAQAELEAFVLALGHDLKAPLANIKGFVELLEEGCLPAEQARHFLARVRSNADVMGRLVTDLMELSRIGIRDEPQDEVVVAEVAREVVRMNEASIAAGGVVVVVASNLPTVRYPRKRLLRVFSNLIGNALVHNAGRHGLRIGITCAAEAGLQTLAVSDNGRGIATDELSRIFEPFSPRTRKSVGTSGLGLAIVRRIVEKKGGTIRVESRPGEGATFFFTVPDA